MAQPSIASMLYSNDYVAVFIDQVEGILHMSSCSGTVVGKSLIFVLCETYFAEMSPKQGNVETSWLILVIYTVFAVLLPLLIRSEAFCT